MERANINIGTQQRAVSAQRAEGGPGMHRISEAAPVSVVIPCYRCAHTIGDAVASVAAQAARPAEVLLIDDGSGDDTLQRLQEIAQSHPPGWIKVIALPRNAGPAAARNAGWSRATQPWIAFLDADDTWHPQKLKLQMEALANDPSIALIAHPMNMQPRWAEPPPLNYPAVVQAVPRHLLMLRNAFQTPSIVLRRDLPFRFDETRKRAEDFMLWAQILLSGYRCARINQVLASLHKPPFGASGLSADLKAMYTAAIDVRRSLHRAGLLGWWQWQLVEVLAWVRYLRRRLLTFTRNHSGALPTHHRA